MTKNTLVLIFSSLIIPFWAWSQSADHPKGCAPLGVQFSADTTLSSYYWDFKNGVVSKLQDPKITFTGSGTYTVVLREGENGPKIGSVFIEVYPEPVISLTADPTRGCAPLNTRLKSSVIINSKIRVNNYHWTFGDGEVQDQATSTQHQYEQAGSYAPAMTIETNTYNCDVTEILQPAMEVYELPKAAIKTDPALPLACVPPLEVVFTNASEGDGLTYRWNFDNGQQSSDKNPAPVLFDKNGVYRVRLYATNDKGCTDSTTKIVTVGKPYLDIKYPDTVCIGQNFLITNRSSLGDDEWAFGPDATPDRSRQHSPVVSFNRPGRHSFSLRVTSKDGQCLRDSTFHVFVEDPSAAFLTLPERLCNDSLHLGFYPLNDSARQYSWQHRYYKDTTYSTEDTSQWIYVEPRVTRKYSKNGPIYLQTQLNIETAYGCVDSFIKMDTIFILQARFMPDRTRGCAPLTVVLSDSSTSKSDIVQWTWDYGDGQSETLSDSSKRTHIYDEPGIYNVHLIVENAMGCIDTSYEVRIEVGDALPLDFSVDKTNVCRGDTVYFSPLPTMDERVGGWHFSTDEGRAHQCPDGPHFFHVFETHSGTVDVTMEVDYNGCFTKVTKQDLLDVRGPFARIDYHVQCDSPYHVLLVDSSDGATSNTWYIEDTAFHDRAHFVYAFDTTGDYSIVLKAENTMTGCPPSLDTVVVHIRRPVAALHIDSLACVRKSVLLDASMSTDADTRCHKGYTWLFNKHRPITWDTPLLDDFQYPISGNWTVQLEVTDINGCKDTSELMRAQVFGIDVEIEADDDRICAPSVVHFKGIARGDTTLTEYLWDFGDGTSGTGREIDHEYTVFQDSITVMLTVKDILGCTHFDTLVLYMYEPITDIFTTPNPAAVCLGDSIAFSALEFNSEGSRLSFHWEFGNGDTSNINAPTLVYDNPGKYDVVLTATEVSSGCQATAEIEAIVDAPPVADFRSTLDPDTVGCANSITRFDAVDHPGGVVSYRAWNLGNGIIKQRTPFIEQAFNKGQHDIQLIVSTAIGCSDTITKSFTFIGPEGDIKAERDTLCPGDAVQLRLKDTLDVDRWTWEVSGRTYRNQNPVTSDIFITDNRDSTQVVLRLFKKNCEAVISKPIYFFRIIADFDNAPGCRGEYRLINNSTSGDLFTWDLGNGQSSDRRHPVTTYEEAGTYPVKLIAQNAEHGCRDSITKQVRIYPNPTPQGEDLLLCEGHPAQLNIKTTSDGSQYTFRSPDGLPVTSDGQTPPLAGQDQFQFLLEETDTNGCVGADTVLVDLVRDLFIPDLDTFICLGDAITLPAEDPYGYYEFRWTPSPEGCDGCDSPFIKLESSDSFTLRYTSPMGCFDSTARFKIVVLNTDPNIPLAFTPNGDQVNDRFNLSVPFRLNEATVKRFEIFNRWGERVYTNSDPTQGWDGNYKGKPAPNGVYLYLLQVSYKGCEWSVKGDLTLIR